MKSRASAVSLLAIAIVASSSCSNSDDPAGTNAGANGGSDGSAGTSGRADAGASNGNAGVAGTAGADGEAGSSEPGANGGEAAHGGAGGVSTCRGAVHSPAAAALSLPSVALTVPSGFGLETIAQVDSARELVALPNGDLLVATGDKSIYLVPNADVNDVSPGAPVVFTTIDDAPVQGVAFDSSSCTVYASSQSGIYAMKYADGQRSASAGAPIAKVRTGPISPNRPAGDTDNHDSTSVAVAGGKVYAGVGSSCNACVEADPTRASVQQMNEDGSHLTTRATRFRNAIALTENPATGTLWAGGAGQDKLGGSHPFEYFDAVSLHSGVADYGWPDCEENHIAYTDGADCSSTVVPQIELPAYSTIIGATFYPGAARQQSFPVSYRGGLFLAAHGSWHKSGGKFVSEPQVVFVAMNGDVPKTPVNWADPTKQWTQFVGGFQLADGKTRIARPAGLAVGVMGSLFIADDQNGYVYRVRAQ
jgi:glucose/arabinose dehydrogenase